MPHFKSNDTKSDQVYADRRPFKRRLFGHRFPYICEHTKIESIEARNEGSEELEFRPIQPRNIVLNDHDLFWGCNAIRGVRGIEHRVIHGGGSYHESEQASARKHKRKGGKQEVRQCHIECLAFGVEGAGGLQD